MSSSYPNSVNQNCTECTRPLVFKPGHGMQCPNHCKATSAWSTANVIKVPRPQKVLATNSHTGGTTIGLGDYIIDPLDDITPIEMWRITAFLHNHSGNTRDLANVHFDGFARHVHCLTANKRLG